MRKGRFIIWFCLLVGWPAAQAVASWRAIAAEDYLIVVNAGNRFSGTPDEIRQAVRALYLKQEQTWPDDIPGISFARPAGSPAAKAFAEEILGLDEAALHAYWTQTGTAPPDVIEDPRNLLREIARDEGGLSVLSGSEAEKLPAKVRVLLAFSAIAPGVSATAQVERFIRENKEQFKRRLTAFLRSQFEGAIPANQAARVQRIVAYKAEESRDDAVVLRVRFYGTAVIYNFELDERFLVKLEDGTIKFLERIGPVGPGDEFVQNGQVDAADSEAASGDIRSYLTSHEDEAAEALDGYIVASGQPYGKRLRRLISYKVLEESDVGSLVEFRYAGWESPYAKQRALVRLEDGLLALYDPAEASRLAPLPESALGADLRSLQADDKGGTEAVTPPAAEASNKEKVQRYIQAHEHEMAKKLAAYVERHSGQLPARKSITPQQARIYRSRVVDVSGNLVRVQFAYIHGFLSNTAANATVNGDAIFHLSWIDDELVIIDHEAPGDRATVPALASTASPEGAESQAADDAGTAFDGLWLSRDQPWHGTIRIERGRFKTQLSCGTLTIRSSGRVFPGGRLEDSHVKPSGGWTARLSGSLEELQIYVDGSSCNRGILSFARVPG